MPVSIRVCAGTLSLLPTRTTLRTVIEQHVRREVEVYNSTQPDIFNGLVQPEESEQILNGFRMKTRRPLDAQVMLDRACHSFERNGFLALIDGRQVTELDQPLNLNPDSEIEFLKLVPLIGG